MIYANALESHKFIDAFLPFYRFIAFFVFRVALPCSVRAACVRVDRTQCMLAQCSILQPFNGLI